MFKCTNYNFHSFEHKVAVNCSAAGAGPISFSLSPQGHVFDQWNTQQFCLISIRGHLQ